MSRVIGVGNFGAISQPTQVDFDPIRGMVTTKEWVGIGPDSLVTLATLLLNNGVAYRLHRGLVSTLVATYSGGQDGTADKAQPSWQLLGNEIQKHVYETGIALSGLGAYPDLLADVDEAYKAYLAKDSDTVQSISIEIPTGAAGQAFEWLMGRLIRGQTNYALGQYVLRRTLSLSNFYTGEIPGEGLAEHLISMGGILDYDMPPVMSQKISSIPILEAHTGYAWTWRQLPSQMVTGAQNRVEVSTEWWWDEWDTVLYQRA